MVVQCGVSRLSQHFLDGNNFSLIVQGGGQRGIFASGVLDKFLERNFDPFSLYIGTSAGALNVATYVARQQGLGFNFVLNYTTHDRFFNLNKFIRKKQPMDLDWALNMVQQDGAIPLDFTTANNVLQNGKHALACVTNKSDLQDYYYPIFTDQWLNTLKATCGIPMLYYNDITFDNKQWIDGSVSAAIPVHESHRRGFKNIVVIRTTPIINGIETNEATDFSINQVEKKRKQFEVNMDHYLKRIGMFKEKHHLIHFHQKLSDKLNELKQNHEHTKYKLNNQRWLMDDDHLYRLVTLQAKVSQFGMSSEMLDIMIAHYKNHNAVEGFLTNPPDDVNLIQIAPDRSLSSRPLLSKKDHLLEDYEHGKMVGERFLQSVGYV